MNKIIQGNCLEEMKYLKRESIDLVVTSPPYDNIREYKGFSFDFSAIAKELFLIVKKGGVVVWVVNDATINGSETGTSFKQALYFKEIGFHLHDTMIYAKTTCSFPDKTRYYSYFEYMFVFSKGKPKTINLIADKPNKYKGTYIHGTDRNSKGEMVPTSAIKNNTGRVVKPFGVRGNIWTYGTGGKSSSDKIAYKHPAIFPEQLAKDHIISWSNEGDLILDPMCGSGTVCKKAKELNRQYIGIDISSDYCEIAKTRIKDIT